MMLEYLYWLAFLVVFAYVAFDASRLSVHAKFVYYLPLLLFLSLVMAATREQFDIAVYERIFNRLVVSPGTWAIDMFPEWGYQYINYVFNRLLNLNFEQFRFVFAFITLVILYFSVSRLTQHQGLFFLLYYPKYFLIGLISHTRSGFVNAFIFFAIDMAARGRYVQVFLLSAALMQIHFSAILMNGISILSKIKLRLIYVILVVPFSILFSIALLPFVTEVLGVFDLRQLNYLESSVPVGSMFGIEFMRRLGLIGICAYLVAYDKVQNEHESLVIKVFLSSIFFYIGFHEARFISDRVGGMLGFVEPMLWIVFLQNHIFASNKRLAFAIVIGYVLVDFGLRAILLDSLPGHYPLNYFLGNFLSQ